MHTVNSAPTVGSQVEQLLPCALSSLPGSISIYSSVPVNRDVRGGCGEGKTTTPWFRLYLMLKFYPDSRSSRPVLSHLALWSREHSNTFPSSSASQEGCHRSNLQLLLGESKQFAGGGKERRQGGNAGGCGAEPANISHPSVLGWGPVFLSHSDSRPGVHQWALCSRSQTREPRPSFLLWLPAPCTSTFYEDNWKGKKR